MATNRCLSDTKVSLGTRAGNQKTKEINCGLTNRKKKVKDWWYEKNELGVGVLEMSLGTEGEEE